MYKFAFYSQMKDLKEVLVSIVLSSTFSCIVVICKVKPKILLCQTFREKRLNMEQVLLPKQKKKKNQIKSSLTKTLSISRLNFWYKVCLLRMILCIPHIPPSMSRSSQNAKYLHQ